MLSSALYWLAWAMLGTLVAFAAGPVVVWVGGLVEWEGEGRKVTIGSPKSLAIVGSTVMALAFGANANFMAIIASAGGSAPPPSPPTSYAAPAAPTIDVVVDDTTTWRMTFSEFAGDGDDTQDSISVTILRAGTTDTLFHAVSGVQSADTIVANDSLKADSLYYGLGRQKGVNGGWSPADSLDVTNTVLSADGTCPVYNSVEVFYEWNANDYADRAALLSAGTPSVSLDSVSLETGQTLFDGSTGKTFRYTVPGDGSTTYATVYFAITGASASATDDTWVEWWVRYKAGAASWLVSSGSDAKSFQISPNSGNRVMLHANHAGPSAWFDTPGSQILYGPFTADSIYGQPYSREQILFGGSGSDGGTPWRRWRFKVSAEDVGGDGELLAKVDSVMVLFNEASPAGGGVSGINLNFADGFTYVDEIAPLGANHAPNNGGTSTWKETSLVCVYNEDPGWSWTNGSDGLLGN